VLRPSQESWATTAIATTIPTDCETWNASPIPTDALSGGAYSKFTYPTSKPFVLFLFASV
jgi:hypothetical protein